MGSKRERLIEYGTATTEGIIGLSRELERLPAKGRATTCERVERLPAKGSSDYLRCDKNIRRPAGGLACG